MKPREKKKDLCCGLTCFYVFKHHYSVNCDEKLDAGNKMQIGADTYAKAANRNLRNRKATSCRERPRAAGKK